MQLKKSSSMLVVTWERPSCGSERGTDGACPVVPGFQYIVTFRLFVFLKGGRNTRKVSPTYLEQAMTLAPGILFVSEMPRAT